MKYLSIQLESDTILINRKKMAIGVHRDLNGRMTYLKLDKLGVFVLVNKKRCEGVAEVMKADLAKAGKA